MQLFNFLSLYFMAHFDVVGHRRKAPPLRFGWIFRPVLGGSESPQYKEYCGLSESSAGTKSLTQTDKKALSCGCPTGTHQRRQIFRGNTKVWNRLFTAGS